MPALNLYASRLPFGAGSTFLASAMPEHLVHALRTRGVATLAQAQKVAEAVEQSPAAKSAWKAVKDALKSRVFIAGVLGVATLYVGANRSVEAFYKKQVYKKIEDGFCPPLPAKDFVLDRADLIKEIADLVQQQDEYYHIIMGAHSTGKTVLMKQVCKELGRREVGAGFIEVGALPKVKFGQQLGQAIGYRFQEHATVFNSLGKFVAGTQLVEKPDGKLDTLLQASTAFEQAAMEYKKRHGKTFVLVIDGVDRLAEQDKEVLLALQEIAKQWAEKRVATVVFVIGSSGTEQAMKEALAWERAWEVVPIPEATIADSAALLRARGIPPKQAQRIAELAGGRFAVLEKAADLLKLHATMEAAERSIMRWAEEQLVESGIMDESEAQQAGLKVIAQLLKVSHNVHKEELPSISIKQWREAVPKRETQQQLTKGNVFKVLHGEGKVTFDNRAVFAFAVEQLPQRLATPLPKA